MLCCLIYAFCIIKVEGLAAGRPMRRRFLGGEDSNLTIDLGSALAQAMLYSTGLPLAQKWGEFMQRTKPSGEGGIG